MAENEYLRIGYGSAYRKSRILLGDPSSSTGEISECVAGEFSGLIHRNLCKHDLLQGIIDAFSDKSRLRKAIEGHGDQVLARLIRDAGAVIQSGNVGEMAGYVFNRLSEGILKNTVQLAREYNPNILVERCDQLYRDLKSSLEKYKTQIVDALVSSMSGAKPARRRIRISRSHVHTGTSLVNTSLLPKSENRRNVTPDR